MANHPSDQMLNDHEGRELVQAIHDRKRLEEIEARLNVASSGPWNASQGATSDGSELCTTHEQKKAFLALSLNDDESPLWLVHNDEVIPAATGDGPKAQANAEFIANAPADVAYLLAELRKRDNALAAALKLAEEWRYKGEFGWGAWQEGQGPDPEGYALDGASADLRAAITDQMEAGK